MYFMLLVLYNWIFSFRFWLHSPLTLCVLQIRRFLCTVNIIFIMTYDMYIILRIQHDYFVISVGGLRVSLD